jgi:uncharacterized protein (DUF2126 family)
MKNPDSVSALKADTVLRKHGIRLTMGGEPTYVPAEPNGPEWSITALGPTKLGYARALASNLTREFLPNALSIHSPGKLYPGEVNPRWTIFLVWRTDGEPIAPDSPAPEKSPRVSAASDPLSRFRKALHKKLGVRNHWFEAKDPLREEHSAWVLPLDHAEDKFCSARWNLPEPVSLVATDGPAGLRLPLSTLAPGMSRRALTVEWEDNQIQVFLPPFLQEGFVALLGHILASAREAQCPPLIFSGYVPSDVAGSWEKLAIAADPGVLEINLPPCHSPAEYASWMDRLETAAAAAGLCSHKQVSPEEQSGTGGGNHLLFGGPSLDQNGWFTHPRWITSLLRYWQHHPSLAYFFTGHYVGSSSQAPRPDESARALYDLEMAYQFLENLGPGDHRQLISETLRHLHTDTSGNTHRSEISFDKFWNTSFDGGCRGLIEFRAVETLPHAHWMSAIAQLWWCLAAHLLETPFTKPLVNLNAALHDRFFLPSHLWEDLRKVLRDLRSAGMPQQEDVFRQIYAWRFPTMLQWQQKGASLTIRKGLESWPLLCETPLEGGNTSRFVDTSIERIEFSVNREFARRYKITVNGRPLPLQPFPGGKSGAGLRYRRSALHPSLHPGIPPQMPLRVAIRRGQNSVTFRLDPFRRLFEPCYQEDPSQPGALPPCKKLDPALQTFDLRLP